MSRKKGRRVVIDASIATAAGLTDNLDSVLTRSFLKLVQTNRLPVVFSQSLVEEWDQHQSKLARQWRGYMQSRGQVTFVDSGEYAALGRRLTKCGLTDVELKEARKDFHLVSAALSTDKIVFSYDNRARELFKRVSETLKEIQNLIWLHPLNHPDATKAICSGGRIEKHWTLGHDADSVTP